MNSPTDGRRKPTGPDVVVGLALAVVVSGLVGCDDEPEIDEEVAERRAEMVAHHEAELTVLTARQLVLLHPDSERQQHAREQLLYLQQNSDRLPVESDDSDEDRRDVEPGEFGEIGDDEAGLQREEQR